MAIHQNVMYFGTEVEYLSCCQSEKASVTIFQMKCGTHCLMCSSNRATHNLHRCINIRFQILSSCQFHYVIKALWQPGLS